MNTEPVSRPPWELNPHRLWSLADMFPVQIKKLNDAMAILVGILAAWKQKDTDPIALDGMMKGCLRNVADIAAELQLENTARICQNAQKALDGRGTINEMYARVTSIYEVYVSETEQQCFLYLDGEERGLYSDPLADFDEAHLADFHSIVFDLEEAAGCMALGRSTACVFHCMRVLEAVTKAIWLSMGSPGARPDRMRGWGDYRVEIEGVVDAATASASNAPSYWSDRGDFYVDIAADLRSVYRAWRNPTMHIEKVYTDKKASDIFRATQALVRDTIAHIDEDGNWI